MRRLALTLLLMMTLLQMLVAVPAPFGEKTPASKPSAATLPQPKFKVGDVAPDFILKDQSGKNVTLHDFRGKKNVALAFYVFAFSGG